MWKPATTTHATAILITEKAKNLFYATPTAMIITLTMAYAKMLVTPGHEL